jgi:hypothetical protein
MVTYYHQGITTRLIEALIILFITRDIRLVDFQVFRGRVLYQDLKVWLHFNLF